MMVTFISQCEKKALKKSRRVLDAFANRIGDNTWQTVITQEGLLAVKKLLRKTATKNTAVSCHWIRSRARSDLLWVVGKQEKFNGEGLVPVNYTEKPLEEFLDDHAWKRLPIIQCAASLAGLFHDFGKASVLFQTKLDPNAPKGTLNYEPYRHEWLSLKLLEAFVEGKTDAQWLDDLAEQLLDSESYIFNGFKPQYERTTLQNMPPFAQLVAWLILSHHKLSYSDNGMPFKENGQWYVDQWLNEEFNASWNSKNANNTELASLVEKNWTVHDSGLPYNSPDWKSKATDLARKAKVIVDLCPSNILHDDLFTAHTSRLCLMLADHYFSSCDPQTESQEDISKSRYYKLYANTYYDDNGNKQYKQQLDEHLIGVAHHAKEIAKNLPKLRSDLPVLQSNHILEKPCEKKNKAKFGWQDKAVKLTRKIAKTTTQHGFFGINMASTGTGKTLANAKIMYALGQETRGARFTVAMGLRTLTMQTGKEFSEVAGLSPDELTVAVGGIAVKALFKDQDREIREHESLGSESMNEIVNAENMSELTRTVTHVLSRWTKPKAGQKDRKKIDKLISAPVLSCTIDHLIPATEGVRGGQQIAPMLRLLTSDLIIDEPDDFGLEDLPALTRLVHWAAMLGSRVLLATATMPPALVYACYQAYQQGWSQFSKANLPATERAIQCVWFDECLGAKQKPKEMLVEDYNEFKNAHKSFVKKRIESLKLFPEQFEKRKAKIVCVNEEIEPPVDKVAVQIASSIQELHHAHHQKNKAGKALSIGLVRMANIDPLVAVAKSLLKQETPENTHIHYCIYHSRYPLAIRSYIEAKLDRLLKRKSVDAIWEDQDIKPHLKNAEAQHHIFVVLASPVAEVGRDHDYDWAVIEPSSMRSIIQIAGRVLRHRDIVPLTENIHLLNQNIKGLKELSPCFIRPGFESSKLKPISSQLKEALNQDYFKQVNAIPRIAMPESLDLQKTDELDLVELEHSALINKLVWDEKPANVWWQQKPHWSAEVQKQQRFRSSAKESVYVLFLESEYQQGWKQKNTDVLPPELGELIGTEIHTDDFAPINGNQYWFEIDAIEIYKALSDRQNKDLTQISEMFGEVSITAYDKDQQIFYFNPQLGLHREYN